MFEELKYIPDSWGTAMRSRNFRNQFVLTLLVFFVSCLCNFHYLRIWQARPGYQINDILLNHLHPYNFSGAIFAIEYSTLLMVVLYALTLPDKFVKGVQMAALLMFARTAAIYFFPLEPPRDMIFLTDPVASVFLHTKDILVTKDLFFSGHISYLALLTFIVGPKYLKMWAATATVLVAAMILDQHVHYSLDVFFAPVVSYTCYKFVLYIHREGRYGLELQGHEIY
ncbi:MAG TPA: phosphatase PAP2-related protein [Chitinophagales bacterium]|nr:phosphatase PAP2-related protein [Chitinophagales bacterium]